MADFKSLTLSFLVLFALPACSTLKNGTTDDLIIYSTPPGATVTLSREKDGEPISCPKTPCTFSLWRRAEFVATVTHPGYEPVELLVTSEPARRAVAGSIVANTAGTGLVVVGGSAVVGAGVGAALSLGAAGGASAGAGALAAAAVPPALGIAAGSIMIDAVSGANRVFVPNPIEVQLVPIGDGEPFIDTRIELFNKRAELSEVRNEVCVGDTIPYKKPRCIAAYEALQDARAALRDETARLFHSPEETQDTAEIG